MIRTGSHNSAATDGDGPGSAASFKCTDTRTPVVVAACSGNGASVDGDAFEATHVPSANPCANSVSNSCNIPSVDCDFTTRAVWFFISADTCEITATGGICI